jgi:hypothetical protein
VTFENPLLAQADQFIAALMSVGPKRTTTRSALRVFSAFSQAGRRFASNVIASRSASQISKGGKAKRVSSSQRES